MSRRAQIVDQTADIWDDMWDVREDRPTIHGWPIRIGWPHGRPRGEGGAGGPRVIVTPDLATHFEAYRLSPISLALPIGSTTIKRVRRLLGHHRGIDNAAWWQERADDLADSTVEDFAARHGRSVGAVVNARHAFFGREYRPAGWWKAPDVAAILLINRPRADIADALGISAGSVGRLRWQLATAFLGDMTATESEGRGDYGAVLAAAAGAGSEERALLREARSQAMRQAWQNLGPDAELGSVYREALRILWGDPTNRDLASRMVQSAWDDPIARAKRAVAMSNPDTRERIRSGNKAFYTEHPEARERSRAAAHKQHSDPELSAKRVAGIKANWAKRKARAAQAMNAPKRETDRDK